MTAFFAQLAPEPLVDSVMPTNDWRSARAGIVVTRYTRSATATPILIERLACPDGIVQTQPQSPGADDSRETYPLLSS